MTTHSLFMTYQYCIHDVTSTRFMTAYPLYMTSHTLYLRHHSHCISDKTPPVYYIIHSIYDISYGVWMTIQPRYLTSHSQYLCNHTNLIDDIINFVCMIRQPQYVWHHKNYIWQHFHSCWHHTHCIHFITPRIPFIASTVAGPLLIVYWLYHTYYMCDMKPTICLTSQEF